MATPERPPAAGDPRGHAWVDWAKGIGIVLVVYGHVADGVFRAGLPFAPALFHAQYVTIYSFHMPLFFFLSGLFFPASWARRGTRALLATKVDTLLYPYVLWSLLQGGVELAMSRYTNHHTTLLEVLSLWQPRQQFWFLYGLFFMFAVACGAYALTPRRWRWLPIALAAVAFLFKYQVEHVPPLNYLAYNGVFFLLGSVTLALADRVALRGWRWFGAAAAAFAVGQVYYQSAFADPHPPGAAAVGLLLGLLGILMTIGLSGALATAGAGWLAALGRYSLPIFLMHTIIASGVRILLAHGLHAPSTALQLALGTSLGLFVPLIVARELERRRIGGVFAAPHALSVARRVGTATGSAGGAA